MQKVKEGYKMTELGEIPEDWEVKSLGDVLINGPQNGLYKSKDDLLGDYECRVVELSNLYSNYKYINCEKLNNINLTDKEKNLYKLKDNDLLVNRVSKAIDGVARMMIFVGNNIATCFESNMMRITVDLNVISHEYLFYLSCGNIFRNEVMKVAKVSNQTSISQDGLKNINIAIPFINEQKKISSILSYVDEQMEINGDLIEKTKELKKGLMQKLLTKGIGHSRFKDTEIGRIPEEWDIKRFKDVSKVSQGLQIAIENRFKEPGANRLPYITIQYLNDKTNYDNQYYVENANKSVICSLDDILMTRTGNTGVVITNENGVFHNNFFKVDYDRSILYKDFLVYYLKSELIQSIIVRYAGTTTIPDLKHGDFYKIPVALPPIAEQKKIAYILLSADEQIDQYESKKEKLQELKKGLMQKLLTGNIRVKV